jgi:cytochrome c oxidase subunit 2
MRTAISALTVLLAAAACAARASDVAVDYCTSCHGANDNGNRAVGAPAITALEPWYVDAQLRAFRDGWRGLHPDDAPGREMRGAVVNLDDADLKRALAGWRRAAARPVVHAVTGDAARGKAEYAPCAVCHGAQGQGDPALHAPRLAGRSDWYLVTQLQNFLAGRRGTHPADQYGQQMRGAASTLNSKQDIDDVVAFIDTLADQALAD